MSLCNSGETPEQNQTVFEQVAVVHQSATPCRGLGSGHELILGHSAYDSYLLGVSGTSNLIAMKLPDWQPQVLYRQWTLNVRWSIILRTLTAVQVG